MCVAVTLVPGAQLTLDELIKMDRANSDGVGMAWVEDDGVHWWKTTKVNPEEVKENLILTAESPRLLHFRLATAGGTKDELCHPFDISPRSICTPQGIGSKVMIHNGHWGRWQEVYKLMNDEDLLPEGPWSDSRLVAYLAHVNPDWLQALGGRVATLDHRGKIEFLGDWQQLREGIRVSNKIWETITHRRGGYPGYNQWSGWGADTPPQGVCSLRSESSEAKTIQHTRQKGYYGKTKEAQEATRTFVKVHQNAWWNEYRRVWSYWNEKTGDVVEFDPDNLDGKKG